jgi:phosphatidylserine decarboxylase
MTTWSRKLHSMRVSNVVAVNTWNHRIPGGQLGSARPFRYSRFVLANSPTTPVTSTRRAGLPIAREGYRLIAAALVVALALWWLGGVIGAVFGAILFLFVLGFFRDPERAVPVGPGLIVSPADGRIIKVARVQDDRFLRGEATLVSIFMSPLDVHVNRVPIAGRVIDIRYNFGKYFRAFADKASLDNEQNAVLMEDERGRRLCFVQIAGFIARRIVCYLGVGMETERGQRCGMIMFGSRADLYLPPEATVCVAVGMCARGGKTVIAQWT